MSLSDDKQEKITKSIWSKPKRFWMFGIPLGGFLMIVVGVLLLAGANTFMSKTSTLEFCISCHEMRDNVYQEYIQSAHYNNQSGVRAECKDCHIPEAWGAKAISKLYAANDVYHKVMGTVDTPEKFEKHRLEMAEHVWKKMRATDSRECRSCHKIDAMNRELQGRSASKKHDPIKMAKSGKTCIDCHQGLVHKLPDGY